MEPYLRSLQCTEICARLPSPQAPTVERLCTIHRAVSSSLSRAVSSALTHAAFQNTLATKAGHAHRSALARFCWTGCVQGRCAPAPGLSLDSCGDWRGSCVLQVLRPGLTIAPLRTVWASRTAAAVGSLKLEPAPGPAEGPRERPWTPPWKPWPPHTRERKAHRDQ